MLCLSKLLSKHQIIKIWIRLREENGDSCFNSEKIFLRIFVKGLTSICEILKIKVFSKTTQVWLQRGLNFFTKIFTKYENIGSMEISIYIVPCLSRIICAYQNLDNIGGVKFGINFTLLSSEISGIKYC